MSTTQAASCRDTLDAEFQNWLATEYEPIAGGWLY